jgi:pilus assembly protein Flp/PilA
MLEMIMTYVRTITKREEGQALVEYALILALVSVVAVGALTALGGSIGGAMQGVADEIAGAFGA